MKLELEATWWLKPANTLVNLIKKPVGRYSDVITNIWLKAVGATCEGISATLFWPSVTILTKKERDLV